MKTFARMIGGAFIVLGVIIILAGFAVIVSGLAAPKPHTTSFPSLAPTLTGFMGILVGGAIGFEGCFLAAIGAALSLLADISQEAGRTSEYMAYLARHLVPTGE